MTATAEALYMTPSAVSQQLAGLSRQLGVTLLEAEGRRVRLTPAAELLLRHTDAVFTGLERADAALAGHLRGETGTVRVGAFSTAIPALVVPAVTALRRDRPGLTVSVREAEAAEAYELLTRGAVDLALSLAAHPPAEPEAGAAFRRFSLHTDPLDVALPADHPLASVRELRLADLAHEPWIYGHSGPWSEITTTVCEAAGFAPVQAHAAADWRAILALVGAGMGVALVPRMAVVEPGEAVALRVLDADRPHRHVVAGVRRGAEEWPALDRTVDALRAVRLG